LLTIGRARSKNMKTRSKTDPDKGGVQQPEGEAPPGLKEEGASSYVEPSGTEREAQGVHPAAGVSPSAEERLASLEMLFSQLQGFGRPSLGPHAIPGLGGPEGEQRPPANPSQAWSPETRDSQPYGAMPRGMRRDMEPRPGPVLLHR